MPIRIGKRTVDAAQIAEATSFLWDADEKGFGLRITANGVKSYVYQYRMGGRQSIARRITIGKHGSPWTPESARQEARRLAILVASGVDPVESERERRRLAVDLNFSSYAQLFYIHYLQGRWKDANYALARLRQHAEPTLGRKALPEISRTDISIIFDSMAGKPAAARLLHSILRKLFRWAVQRGDLERSPMDGAIAPPPVASRERALSDDELAAVWHASGELHNRSTGFVRMLILTGARRQEVASLDWCELSQTERLWTLPRSRTKNGITHILPLSKQSTTVLDDLSPTERWPAGGLIFTSTGSTPISGFGKIKSRLDETSRELFEIGLNRRDRRASDFAPWRFHDLRRTVATGLQRLGVRFEVTEAVLNHVSNAKGGVAGVYQRYNWATEKAEALQRWGNHVQDVTRVQTLDF